jgi:sulfotransferase
MKQISFLTGLPRTGSTLLSSILSQNEEIHAEGNSAVCQLMWDMYISCALNSKEQLSATQRANTSHDLISSIPHIYYKNTPCDIIVDKCRSWTIEDNIFLIKNYININPKFIVLIRPIEEIVLSFMNLRKDNNWKNEDLLGTLLLDGTEPLMRSLYGVLNVMNNHKENCIFISYDSLVNDTETTVNNIYKFCGWKPYKHDFTKIINKHPEDDTVYGLVGQHDVRPTITKREFSIELPSEVIGTCHMLNSLIFKE